MERLTERTSDGILVKEDYGEDVLKTLYQCYGAEVIPHYANCDEGYCAMEKLAAYENAEEQGLLLKLPCKVGDTVYAYCSEFGIIPYVVDCIVINEHITFQCSSYSGPIGDCPSECLDEIEPDITDFGKTVFLTQAEAEQKLKEMKS